MKQDSRNGQNFLFVMQITSKACKYNSVSSVTFNFQIMHCLTGKMEMDKP